MAMPLSEGTVVSLDSALFIAALICLGSVTAGRLVALALTLETLARLLRVEPGPRRARRSGWADDLLYVSYFGGMTGALLMAIGWALDTDRFPAGGARGGWATVELVLASGGAFLAIHYAVQGGRLALTGRSPRAFIREVALPGAVAEASLLPLAVVVVFIYRPERPLAFLLLGATYVVVNYFFSRLTDTSNKLGQRVKELETLNHASRALAASLQLHELVESLARETVRAIRGAELVTLVRRDDGGLVVDSYDAERDRFARFSATPGEGASGWVMARGRALSVPDFAASEFGAGSAGVRSWLGVPLVIAGEVEGVLAVQSYERSAFDRDHLRVLEAIGAQAAIALQNAQLYELAMIDGLTGLFVRRYFDARLREEVERSRRFDTAFSVVTIDIDDFKCLNDTHGHQAGDAVLVAVASTVKRGVRGVDTAARYGGEELALVLPRTTLLDAYNQAERVRASIEELRFPVADGAVRVTASFGVASFPESGGGGAADVVRRADVALYRAKKRRPGRTGSSCSGRTTKAPPARDCAGCEPRRWRAQ
jgi:diguanylate cyclase (GGDEF)-like protein